MKTILTKLLKRKKLRKNQKIMIPLKLLYSIQNGK